MYIHTLCLVKMPAHTIYFFDILLITVLKKFTVLHENLISGVFACFVGVFARFVGVSARKKI